MTKLAAGALPTLGGLTATAGACLLVTLVGCTPAATSIELAEHAVRTSAVDVAEQLASYAAGLESPTALAPSELGKVTENLAIDDAGSPVPSVAPGLQVGFASSSTTDTLTVSAVIRGHGQTHSGLGGTQESFYGCGDFVADFQSRRVTVQDVECPSWLTGWIGQSDPVSITHVAGGALEEITW